jgi:hypothetical protein
MAVYIIQSEIQYLSQTTWIIYTNIKNFQVQILDIANGSNCKSKPLIGATKAMAAILVKSSGMLILT